MFLFKLSRAPRNICREYFSTLRSDIMPKYFSYETECMRRKKTTVIKYESQIESKSRSATRLSSPAERDVVLTVSSGKRTQSHRKSRDLCYPSCSFPFSFPHLRNIDTQSEHARNRTRKNESRWQCDNYSFVKSETSTSVGRNICN